MTTTDIVHISTTGKQLAVIEDTRPWHVRAWDASALDGWAQQVMEALHNGSTRALVGLVEQLKVIKPETGLRAPEGYAHVFHNIDADIMARPAPRRRG
jgi:hypothetical protein